MSSKACQTKFTPSSKVIIKRVIRTSVIGKIPSSFFFKKNGITEPLDPITFPYLTTENLVVSKLK